MRDAMGEGMPEGMAPEGRQEGTPEGSESVVPEGMLAGMAIAVDARMAAERAKDFILSINECIKFNNFDKMKGRLQPGLMNDLFVRNDKKKSSWGSNFTVRRCLLYTKAVVRGST